MRITNHYKETVYWRAFKENDVMYGFGLKEGAVKRGHTDKWRDDSFPGIKVEVKTGGILFPRTTGVLVAAGEMFAMSDDLVVTATGDLAVAKVELLPDPVPRTEQRSHVLFVDLRRSTAPSERRISSKFETAFSSTEGFERGTQDEETWSVDGKVGGTVGVKLDLSAQFQKKVVTFLETSRKQTVSSVWSQSWDDSLVLAAGRLHAIEVVWTVTLTRGTAAYFGETTTYSVVSSAVPSLLGSSEYATPEELPPAYLEKWKALPRSGA